MREFMKIVESVAALLSLPALMKKYPDTVPFAAIGWNQSETGLNRHPYEVFRKSSTTKSRHEVKLVAVSSLVRQDQDGLSTKTLRWMSDSVGKTGLPEVIEIGDGLFWVMEGHHRIATQIIKGQRMVEVTVDSNPYIIEHLRLKRA